MKSAFISTRHKRLFAWTVSGEEFVETYWRGRKWLLWRH